MSGLFTTFFRVLRLEGTRDLIEVVLPARLVALEAVLRVVLELRELSEPGIEYVPEDAIEPPERWLDKSELRAEAGTASDELPAMQRSRSENHRIWAGRRMMPANLYGYSRSPA